MHISQVHLTVLTSIWAVSYIACCTHAFVVVLVAVLYWFEASKQADMFKVWQRQEQQVEWDPGGLPFP